MSRGETFQGFVPITVLLPGQRIEGQAWKTGGQRLLQHVEQDGRRFLPVVEARVFDLSHPDASPTTFSVIAVNTAAITAIIPGDTATPVNATGGRRAHERTC
jgi:hypothetical protein